jgi:putative transcriptional regulator
MKKELFDELLESVRQGGAILRGERKATRTFRFLEPNVRKIRQRYGLSQQKFAALLGISIATFRNWEQGHFSFLGPENASLTISCSCTG